jgi:hypothetical protein
MVIYNAEFIVPLVHKAGHFYTRLSFGHRGLRGLGFTYHILNWSNVGFDSEIGACEISMV